MISHGARGFAISLFAFESFSFIIQLLAATHTDLELGATVLEINLGRHKGQPLFIDLLDQLVDLVAIEQKLARAQRLMVFAIPLFVGADVHVVDKHLAVANAAVGFLDAHLPHADRLDLGPLESQARFDRLINEIFVISLFIVGNDLYTHEIR